MHWWIWGQDHFMSVLSLDTSHHKITVQSCSSRSSWAYQMVCWFPNRQIFIFFPTSLFSSPWLFLSLLTTSSHYLPCTISFAHENLPPFLSTHSSSRKKYRTFFAALLFHQVGKLIRSQRSPRMARVSVHGKWQKYLAGSRGDEKEKWIETRTSPCWWLWSDWLIGSSHLIEWAQNVRAL